MLSFAKNTLANYFCRFYIIFIGITIVPLYLQYLGATAFGLISLYAVMQSWLNILDLGLIPALSREVAYYRHKPYGFIQIKQLLRSLEIIFLIINLIIFMTIAGSSHWIAHQWLNIENLNETEVIACILMISVMISLRWFGDLYRSGILAMEQQVWVNAANMSLITLQYVGAYALLRWITHQPSYFFIYQLFIAILEPFILGRKFYKILPVTKNYLATLTITWKTIKKVFPFASSVFYTSSLWILLTQSDKLILSHLLSLSTYGYFALVSIISGGLLQLTAPISQALLPNLTDLFSRGKNQTMLSLYRNATQLVAVIMLPLVGIIATFPSETIFIWTGDKLAAQWAGPILSWYTLGNGLLSLSAFQYYLQFAYGNLKLHVIFNTLFALISFPIIVWAAYYYGALGTSIVWFLMQLGAFLIWPPIVHHRYARGIHHLWLLKDILPIMLTIIVLLLCVKTLPINFKLMSRNESFTMLGVLAIVGWIAGVLASSACRDIITTFIQGRRDIKV